ncbi:SpaA isopeptide-forming pilin-related protein [Lentilactobacillus senioris]|uniref:SpaA isopeptide-forming pilin-related protein n=1 Tax=Lentilactobacillus senioris TaxID=931534 RepID=UPI0006CF7558|nr:pilin N-terminal domain-containing protein [Lentilactobacillus senioris]
MKFKKILRTLAVTALMFVGGSAINASAEVKSTPAPDENVNIQLHKMFNTDSSKTITNTGSELTGEALNGMTPYDATKNGNVEFTIFKVGKGLLDPDNMTEAEYATARDALISQIKKGATTPPSEIIDNQNDFIETNTANNNLTNSKALTLQDSSGILEFNNITNNGTYLILETKAANLTDITSISAPLIFNLPITGVSGTAHLYAKNLFPKDTTTQLTKKGIDPLAPTNITNLLELENVEFTITNSSGYNKKVTTDANGNITFGNLAPGEYTITETSISSIPWYQQMKAENPISMNFTVAEDGTITTSQKNNDYFIITKDKSGNVTGIEVKNYLITGGADFIKVDADENTKLLEGAKFIVKKESFDESGNPTTEYAKFNNSYEFTGWGNYR